MVDGDFAGGSEGPGRVSAVRFRTVAYTGPGRRRFRGFGTSGTADVRSGFPVPVVPLCWWLFPVASAGVRWCGWCGLCCHPYRHLRHLWQLTFRAVAKAPTRPMVHE